MQTQLQYFYGIGAEMAKKIHKQLLRERLIDAKKEYSLSRLKHILKKPVIYDTLPVITQHDLRYNPERRIPRDRIHDLETRLRGHSGSFPGLQFFIRGSYFRGKLEPGDIDIVVCCRFRATDGSIVNVKSRSHRDLHLPDDFREFKKIFNREIRGFRLCEPFATGPSKIALMMSIGHRQYAKVDLFFTTPETLIGMLLFATGSGKFNLRMRYIAKHRGYLLNQYGLYRLESGKKILVPVTSEREIFDILRIRYLTPEQRI